RGGFVPEVRQGRQTADRGRDGCYAGRCEARRGAVRSADDVRQKVLQRDAGSGRDGRLDAGYFWASSPNAAATGASGIQVILVLPGGSHRRTAIRIQLEGD